MNCCRRLRLLAMVVLTVGLASAALGQSKGSGPSSTGGNKTTGSAPSGTPTSPDQLNRVIMVSGNVITADGSPLPEPVSIERVCNGHVARKGRTDFKGYFSVDVGESYSQVGDPEGSAESGGGRRGLSLIDSLQARVPQSSSSSTPVQRMLLGCELRGSLAGFRSSSLRIPLDVDSGVGIVNVGTIVLERMDQAQGATVSATSLKAPKDAKKAYDKGHHAVANNKLPEAQQNLEKAVQLYPQYAVAWLDLGWVYTQQNQLDKARNAFQQAQTADEKFVPAYVGLSSVAVRESKWQEAADVSARATQLDGVDFPLGFYYNAVANFELGQLDKAEKSARKAEQLDMRQSLPQVKLLLGSIQAKQQNYAEAAEEFKGYLKVAPTAANAERVRQRLAELERLSTSPDPPPTSKDLTSSVAVAPATEVQLASLSNWEEIGRSAAGNPKPPALALPQSWVPPDIDQVVPPVSPGVPCSVHEVVSGVSSRAKELMDNIQQFTATERIEHLKVDKAGNPGRSASATFKYFAEIREAREVVKVEEYRNGSSSGVSFPANLATTGMAAHALMFHPSMIDDLTVTCEGLGRVRGKPAWQLHFVQRPDRPPRFREYHTQKGSFRVELKGRAWIAADSYQVLRMETDLVKPIEEIALHKDHVIIDYRAVEFRKRQIQLWLPETTDLYLDFLGQRSHRRHSFSDFELFWVETAQKIRDPEVR